MKFIHAADLHLDRGFEGLKEHTNESQKIVEIANEKMFGNLIELCKKEAVDFLILAGDTFHQATPSIYTQNLFMKGMQALAAKNIKVILTFGNHDYFSPEKYWFPFPENVIVFSEETVTTKKVETAAGEIVAISGFSYRQRWLSESKVAEFPNRLPDVDYHIGIYHGALANHRENRYAPFTVSSLANKNYDYWSLGHIHTPQVLMEKPTIIYAGTPQGHHKKEEAATGVVLVTLKNGFVDYNWQPLAVVSWHKCHCNLKGMEERQEIFPKIWESLAENISTTAEFNFLSLVVEELSGSLLSELANRQFLSHLNQVMPSDLAEKVLIIGIEFETSHEGGLPLGITPQLLDFVAKDLSSLAQRDLYRDKLGKQRELVPYMSLSEEVWQEVVSEAKSLVLLELETGEGE